MPKEVMEEDTSSKGGYSLEELDVKENLLGICSTESVIKYGVCKLCRMLH